MDALSNSLGAAIISFKLHDIFSWHSPFKFHAISKSLCEIYRAARTKKSTHNNQNTLRKTMRLNGFKHDQI